MKLEDIGFYTLCDERAFNSSEKSRLWRCELILTDRCNFKCPYCRGLRNDISGEMPFERAEYVVKEWIKNGLKNVRFSGGEPTLYPNLEKLIAMCKDGGVEKIAISTNGSASKEKYTRLIEAGVNDFSVSLDACCAAVGDKMAGGVNGAWDKVVDNIRWLADRVYTTVGIVVNEENISTSIETIRFADTLGVADVRIIPSSQYDKMLVELSKLSGEFLDKHPILKYRVTNAKNGLHVRGLKDTDCKQCKLVLDDMAVAGKYHFPCIIYMREQGDPIGEVNDNMRQDRKSWMESHDCFADPICKKNCLDVCIDFNNKARDKK